MNKKFSFLVLTDHRPHTPGNPVYFLLTELLAHPDCGHIHVASRGNPANDGFFYHQTNAQLEVLEINAGFEYEETGSQFSNTHVTHHVGDYDCILMRLPRPVEVKFMDFLVDHAPRAVMINHPYGIEKTSNKAFLLNLPELCPPIKLCNSIEDILDFAAQFPIVLKPLKEYGGKGILKIDGENLYEGNTQYNTLDFLQKMEDYIQKEGYLAMKFLEQVTQGDKRTLMIGGKILGSSLRMPPEGSWMCNVAQGGKSIPTIADPEEIQIIEHIYPFLEKEGILIAGIDTLMGDEGKRVLSEINTLSVGGFKNIQQQTGRPVIEETIQIIIDYVNQKINN